MPKIVIAMDGSEHAENAFRWYVQNFHKPDHEVYFVHCPEDYTHIQIFEMSPARARELQVESDSNAAKLKQKILDLAKALNVSIPEKNFISKPGLKPGEVIVDVAEELGATTLVTGTRGMGKIRRTIMGSVSDYIMYHAHCPVLVCRHK